MNILQLNAFLFLVIQYL